MKNRKEEQKEWNRGLTKEEQLKVIYEMEEEGKILIESNKQRINISVHSGLWKRLDKFTTNKSNVVEELLKKYLEKLEGKEIILRKKQF